MFKKGLLYMVFAFMCGVAEGSYSLMAAMTEEGILLQIKELKKTGFFQLLFPEGFNKDLDLEKLQERLEKMKLWRKAINDETLFPSFFPEGFNKDLDLEKLQEQFKKMQILKEAIDSDKNSKNSVYKIFFGKNVNKDTDSQELEKRLHKLKLWHEALVL